VYLYMGSAVQASVRKACRALGNACLPHGQQAFDPYGRECPGAHAPRPRTAFRAPCRKQEPGNGVFVLMAQMILRRHESIGRPVRWGSSTSLLHCTLPPAAHPFCILQVLGYLPGCGCDQIPGWAAARITRECKDGRILGIQPPTACSSTNVPVNRLLRTRHHEMSRGVRN